MPASLECGEIVYRGVRKRHVRVRGGNRFADPAAFVLRRRGEVHEPGLSVDRARLTTLEECLQRLPLSEGIVSLHCGHVRALGLAVEAAPTERNLAHARIVGFPTDLEDVATARLLARDLADQARWVIGREELPVQ